MSPSMHFSIFEEMMKKPNQSCVIIKIVTDTFLYFQVDSSKRKHFHMNRYYEITWILIFMSWWIVSEAYFETMISFQFSLFRLSFIISTGKVLYYVLRIICYLCNLYLIWNFKILIKHNCNLIYLHLCFLIFNTNCYFKVSLPPLKLE